MTHLDDPNGPRIERTIRTNRQPDGTYPQFDTEIDNVLSKAATEATTSDHGTSHQEEWARPLSRHQVTRAVGVFADFIHQQRVHYYPQGQPIGPRTKAFLSRFFEPGLLDQVRVLKLKENRVPNPVFFEEARELGYQNLPDLKHLASLTFLDVVVFNEKITERPLFHGLVHAVQVHALGVDRYAELFVRGFFRTRSYFMIPLKAHAFALDCRFAENRERGFSVETEVFRWIEEGRY